MSSMLEPKWSEEIKESNRALDPLGYNRVNYRMVDELVLGFTTQTHRARYYSFYLWTIGQIRKTKSAKNFRQFKKAFKNFERLFMLSCVAHEDMYSDSSGRHTSIIGSNKGKKILMKDSKIPLNFPYLGHDLGGYGQYYTNSMYQLDLIEDDEEYAPKPTELGLDVIKHFDKLAIPSGIKSYYEKKSISKNKLKEIGEKICLCKLREQDAEKAILIKIFFGFAGPDNRYSISRQKSLTLILSAINQAHKQNYRLEAQDFLNSIYFDEIGTLENPIKIITPPKLKKDIAKKWKFVKAHDNLALASESILQSFLGFLVRSSEGKPLEEFYQHIFSGLNDKFEKLLDSPGENFVDMSIWKIISIVMTKDNIKDNIKYNDIMQVSEKYDSTITLSSKLCEQQFIINLEELVKTKAPNPTDIIANAISLTLLTALRLYRIIYSDKASNDWLKNLEKTDVGICKFVIYVKKFMGQNRTLREFTHDFIEKYVIKQAKDIYKDKMRSGTNTKRWFHQEGSNYVKDREYYARHREIRFSAALFLLHDLGLITKSEDLLECTSSGKDMLKRVLST